jgi:tRNA-Thr(GGU) m(6)t(6)A37 methyltransferase TsaA
VTVDGESASPSADAGGGDTPGGDDLRLVPVGHVETPFESRDDCPRFTQPDGPECRLVLDAPYDEALFGLEPGDAIIVLCWFDESDRTRLRQRRRGDGPIRGTFDLRSPHRPNPIGLNMVRIERIEGNVVVVRGLDCRDGTPLLDIKPVKREEFPS